MARASEVRWTSCHNEITTPHELPVIAFCPALPRPHGNDRYAEQHERLSLQGYRRIPINHVDAALRVATFLTVAYLGGVGWLIAHFWDRGEEPTSFTAGVVLGLLGTDLAAAWYLRWRSWVRFELPVQSRWFRARMGRHD